MRKKTTKTTTKRSNVEKPFNGGQWTHSRYFGFIRAALRMASRKWPPRIAAKHKARRPIQTKGRMRRQKWEYQCSICENWFPDKETEVDHILPCGRLGSYDDLPEFTRRLFCEASDLRVVCKFCHKLLTARQETATTQSE